MGCGTSSQSIKNVQLISHNDIYQRRQLIGVGHHGRVYKSYYQIDKKQYANKIIDQFRPHNNIKNIKSHYSQLINKLKSLKHQKIATYHHFQINDKEISIIMELCKQGTLKKYIQKNGTSQQSFAANIIQNVLQALQYLHSTGIIHKDFKSSNILLILNEQIKLSDYAIAELYDERLMNKDSKKNKIVRQIDYYRAESLPYMAPQVIKNIEITQKSDVWSVGCVLLQLLTGKTPWSECANNFQQAFKIISSNVFPPFSSQQLSQQCKSFLQGCLAVIPTQRLSVKQLINHNFIRTHSKNKNDSLLLDQSQQFLNKQIQQKDKNDTKKTKHNRALSSQYNLSSANRYSSDINKINKNDEYRSYIKSKASFVQQNQQINQSLRLLNSKQNQTINKQDIKPIIQQQPYTVTINNKKVQLQPYKYKNKKINDQNNKIIHQIQQWASPMINKQRKDTISKNSYQNDTMSKNSYQNDTVSKNSFQNKDKNKISNSYIQNQLTNRNRSNSHYQDSLDAQLKVKNLRVETQPYFSQNFDKDYFKKPLKLLKKKLKQNKELNDFSRKLSQITNNNISTSVNNISQFISPSIDQYPQSYQPFQSSKIRVRTQARRQQLVINTELARAQRDRYINQQKLMKKMRQQQKMKWQDELKKGSQILKAQIGKYYYPQIKLNLKN